MTTDSHSPDETAVQLFDERLRGELLRSGDARYDDARAVWNAMIDRRPALIARCTGAADVITAVEFARENDLLVAVRGGGHNVAGDAVCDDGLVIDLSPMNAVHVDPAAKTARVAGGATLGDLDHETQAFGLATTGGIMSETGVAGLTLGGGLGWLARKFGLAHDNLRSADVVTATGELVTVSEHEHQDLFWGIRGGGGNFGIVTSFEFDLHEVSPELCAGSVHHRFEDATAVLRFYRQFMADAPDDVQCSASFWRVSGDARFPEDVQGETIITVNACYAGSIENGKETLQPLTEFGEPILVDFTPWRYTAWQQRSDGAWRKGFRNYWKSHYFRDLSDDAIYTLVDTVTPLPTPRTVAFFDWMGGAISHPPPDATAFPDRDKACAFTIASRWTDPVDDDACIEWARAVHEALEPYAADGVYVNYLGQGETEQVRAAYRDRYDRLVSLKNEWDPENLFCMNQNVEPTIASN